MTTEGDVMEKIKKFARDNWTRMLMLLLISASAVCIMLDIVKYFNISKSYSPYIVIIPLGLGICMKIFYARKEKMGQIENIVFVLCMAIVEYFFLIMKNKVDVVFQVKILIYILTSGSVLLFFVRKEISMSDKHEVNEEQKSDKKIFSLYYINTDKVYEIAMLLNNKIITGGTRENETESSVDIKTSLGINSNLSYLEAIKGELGLSKEVHDGMKSKVLENFDVKTTKSNMLARIISKAKDYDDASKVGDLVCLRNVTLSLMNEEDSYAVTKMILNGAFKDTKISSNSDDMQIELDLSAMINSVLKDCAYELECKNQETKFLITVPMTFENDFENSYNIYDLQAGSVTVIGINRGVRKHKRRKSLQEIFSEKDGPMGNGKYENQGLQLESSTEEKDCNIIPPKNDEDDESETVIDVIAIIQEINSNI
jgi:Ca2+/Na+ antiporter